MAPARSPRSRCGRCSACRTAARSAACSACSWPATRRARWRRVRDQYDLGVEPSALLRGLLEAVHGITRAKVGGARDAAQSAEEREAYADWAGEARPCRDPPALAAAAQGPGRGAQCADAAGGRRDGAAARHPRLGAARSGRPDREAGERRDRGAARAPQAPKRRAARPNCWPRRRVSRRWSSSSRRAASISSPTSSATISALVDYAPPVLRLQAARAVDAQGIDRILSELRAFPKTDVPARPGRSAIDEGPAQPSLREQELAAEEALPRRRCSTRRSSRPPSRPSRTPSWPATASTNNGVHDMPDMNDILQMAQEAQTKLMEAQAESRQDRGRGRVRRRAGQDQGDAPRAGSSASTSTRACWSPPRSRWSRIWSPPRSTTPAARPMSPPRRGDAQDDRRHAAPARLQDAVLTYLVDAAVEAVAARPRPCAPRSLLP